MSRLRALRRIESALEVPLMVLGLVWVGLLVVELAGVHAPWLGLLVNAIWAVFIVEFLVRFSLAPRKASFLARNALTVLSLGLPALRVLRVTRAFPIFRLARTARGLRLLRIVTSTRRGMRSLAATMDRHGFGYLLALTLLVTFAGAGGMYSFERSTSDEQSFRSFGAALWWTAMIVTTMGSENWPRTNEGRILCLLLALYAFAAFGYVTAVLATFLIGREPQRAGSKELVREIARLRELLERRERPVEPQP